MAQKEGRNEVPKKIRGLPKKDIDSRIINYRVIHCQKCEAFLGYFQCSWHFNRLLLLLQIDIDADVDRLESVLGLDETRAAQPLKAKHERLE